MKEIFVTVVIAVFATWVLIKYWREILASILATILILLSVVILIVTFPIRVVLKIISLNISKKDLIREYDRIFCEAKSMREVTKINKKIDYIQNILDKQAEQKTKKEHKKHLREIKWSI